MKSKTCKWKSFSHDFYLTGCGKEWRSDNSYLLLNDFTKKYCPICNREVEVIFPKTVKTNIKVIEFWKCFGLGAFWLATITLFVILCTRIPEFTVHTIVWSSIVGFAFKGAFDEVRKGSKK